MTGIVRAEIRDFAFDPYVAEFAFEMGANSGDEIPNPPDTAGGGLETETELIGGGHWVEFTGKSAISRQPSAIRKTAVHVVHGRARISRVGVKCPHDLPRASRNPGLPDMQEAAGAERNRGKLEMR